jgi:hypothetical protein
MRDRQVNAGVEYACLERLTDRHANVESQTNIRGEMMRVLSSS